MEIISQTLNHLSQAMESASGTGSIFRCASLLVSSFVQENRLVPLACTRFG